MSSHDTTSYSGAVVQQSMLPSLTTSMTHAAVGSAGLLIAQKPLVCQTAVPAPDAVPCSWRCDTPTAARTVR